MNGGTSKILRGRRRRAGEPERAYVRYPSGTIRLSPDCDRYRYQRLKREYKRGEVTP